MEHLLEVYPGIPIEPVPYHRDLKSCLDRSHGYSYQDFIHFPSHHGFRIDENYRILSSPDSGKCQELHRWNRYGFLQAWLYFALLRCVVRGDKPLLAQDELINARRIYTRNLPQALKEWSHFMYKLHSDAPDEAEMRCLEANQILVLAKRVVIAELANNKEARHGDPEELQDLCLMILGETLSSALIHIMKNCQITIPGWQIEDGGWGPPQYVFAKMRKWKWCERFQEVLKNQLGQNATLLYVTLKKLGAERSHPDHGCTPKQCNYVEARHTNPKNADARYEPQHYRKCHKHPDSSTDDQNSNCWMVGPDERDLIKIVNECKTVDEYNVDQNNRNIDFPLLQVEGEGDKLQVKVVKWSSTQKSPYATISHVWAHGLGNKTSQGIWHCQLQYIVRLLEKVSGTSGKAKGRYFWLDTLAIPANDTAARQNAIKSIYDVFDNAAHGIVVDKYLLKENSWDDSRIIGLRLLSSGWMQRLWTLQEAFVSKQLSMAFKDENVRDIDELWTSEGNADFLVDSLTEMVVRKLTQNLMGEERKKRNEERETKKRNEDRKLPNAKPDLDRPPLLIASAWHSARYRTVARLENETQVLSCLLNVLPPVLQEISQDDISKDDPKWPMLREELMARFWDHVACSKHLEHAIPAGMIFLPGKRLNIRGFGWSPATSMSGKDEDYPFPLTRLGQHTELRQEGLVVTYPGYLIRSLRSKCADIISQPFHFSVNFGLYDWYQATPVAEGTETSDAESVLQEIRNDMPPRLAVIISRPRPVESPAEIGLLVNVYKIDVEPSLFHCRIIRRVKLSRVSDPRTLGTTSGEVADGGATSDRMLSLYAMFDPGIVGVATSEQQRWCVDGYVTSDTRPNVGTAGRVPDQQAETAASGGRASQSRPRRRVAHINAPIGGAPPTMGPEVPNTSRLRQIQRVTKGLLKRR